MLTGVQSRSPEERHLARVAAWLKWVVYDSFSGRLPRLTDTCFLDDDYRRVGTMSWGPAFRQKAVSPRCAGMHRLNDPSSACSLAEQRLLARVFFQRTTP